jgi:hypothetical protein
VMVWAPVLLIGEARRRTHPSRRTMRSPQVMEEITRSHTIQPPLGPRLKPLNTKVIQYALVR